jgi:cytochrome d ubiquinol oxidase subunit I
MKVTQAATTNDGVWATFLVIAALYIGVAVTLVLILRAMSRRFREEGDESDTDAPYGPRAPVTDAAKAPEKVGAS